MTVFYDRSKAVYRELSGKMDINSGQFNINLNKGYSGGQPPTRQDIKKQYPLDQTTSVVDTR